MNWGYYIKRLREEAGLTQHQLAEKAGMKRSHISRIEMGAYQTFKIEMLNCLAYGLGRSTSELVDLIYGQSAERALETPEQILERLRLVHPVTVPIYEDYPLHAGAPAEPMDYAPVQKDRAKGRNLEGYIVHGDCLKPEIQDGDIIIVDRDGQIDIGNIVACLFRDMLHLGRLRKIGDEMHLKNNDSEVKLDWCQAAAPVIEVRRRLK